MKKIPYEVVMKNTRLTDFSGLKDMVIANKVKQVPDALKSVSNSEDKHLSVFG